MDKLIFRPRITDVFGIQKSQAEIDFAIQFLGEDVPLYVDPFLLWKSPSQQDQALHTSVTNCFNHLNTLVKSGRSGEAEHILVESSECSEAGLGVSKTRAGKKISQRQAAEILDLFRRIPQYGMSGFTHFEVIQLYVHGISKDRVSDIACNFLKSFLVDYTLDQCSRLGIGVEAVVLPSVYNYRKNALDRNVTLELPVNPETKSPLLFTPKRWLRYTPWLNLDDYFRNYCPKDELVNPEQVLDRVSVLNFNRESYDVVERYVKEKERTFDDCKNDPLFTQIPITSAKRKLDELLKLKTGKEDGADWRYEDIVSELFASVLYPHLDFAQSQSRTDSGRHIRDLIFYNNRSVDFLDDIHREFGNQQLVFEMKNVNRIDRDHINQLSRYLQPNIGNFGVFVTRNPLTKEMFQNTIDLWSAHRKCIIALTDEEVKLMVNVYETHQRTPIEVLKKKLVDFKRSCPT